MLVASLANIENGAIGGGHGRQVGKSADLITQSEAASILNVSERLVRDAKAVARAPRTRLLRAIAPGETYRVLACESGFCQGI